MNVHSYTRWGRWLLPLLLFLITLAVFLPALNHDFVNWDDDKNLADNPHYRGLGPAALRWMWTTYLTGHYIPVTWMSFGLDYVLWGMDPFGYHLTNLILHAANAVLLYLLALVLLRMANPSGSGGNDWGLALGAAFAALFFALHPLRVESVVWVTERRDVLSGLFCLLAALTYVRAAQGAGRKYLVACLIFFVLALLSKEIAVTLPAVFVVLDVFPLKRLGGGPGRLFGRTARSVWVEKIPFFALSLVVSAATLRSEMRAGVRATLADVSWLRRIEMSIYGFAFYVRKTVAPLHLSPMYLLTNSKVDPWGLPFLFSSAIVFTITAIALVARRKHPGLLAAWLAYCIILLPVAGIFQNGRQIAADRYSYLACLGWALLAGGLAQICWRRWGGRPAGTILIPGVCALALIGLSFLTSKQIRVWSSSETLWTYAISREPSPVAYQNLAMAVARQGNYSEAIEYLRRALRIDPHDAEVHNDLGACLLALGRTDEAMLHFRAALHSKPDLANSHYGLGYGLSMEGKLDEAIEEFQTALKLQPDYESALRELNKALALKAESKP